ncbi:DUF4019 domain-containing protein [Variovorax sp. RHLX14]|uniref:DUF4019 domain-containing protein n=1 Tax=Variovorax sp. RHLX14 TaxID=1259731 RepID=UPI003F46574F
MKYLNIRTCISVVSFFAASVVFDAAAAEKDISPVDVVGLGAQVLQQIDGGQVGWVWDNASPVLKAQVSKEQFGGKSLERRRGFTAIGDRIWMNVSRNRFPQAAPPAPPAGFYANVVFVTPGAAGDSLSELVSFRLEPDNKWRITGYVPEIRK